MATRTMLVVTDATGRVVAAAHLGPAGNERQGVGIAPLPGQTIHEVEVPEPLTRLSGRDFHQFMSQARIMPGTLKLAFPEIRIRRHDGED